MLLRIEALLLRLSRGVDVIAGICLAVVTVVMFVSAVGRYAFAAPIPDGFDLARLLLGVAVMWGFASLGFRGGHIEVDLIATSVRPWMRRVFDVAATAILLGFTILLAWKLYDRFGSALRSNEATYDLRLPVWPLIGLIWLGAVAAVITTTARLIVLLRRGSIAEESDPA